MIAMESEFEEKEYEIPLLLEMLSGPLFWSPGQVLENRLGFDACLEASMAYWNHVGRTRRLGVQVRHVITWSNIYRTGGKRATPAIPANASFSVNLFLQVKRCSYHPAGMAPKAWKSAPPNAVWYYIKKYAKQQGVLDKLARLVRNNRLGAPLAEVAYAGPCFHARSALFTHARNAALMDNSSFPDAKKLARHNRWSYYVPGSSGVARSKPQFIEGEPLGRRLAKLAKENPVVDNRPNVLKQLQSLEQMIRVSFLEAGVEWQAVDVASDRASDFPRESNLAGRIAANLAMQDIQWLIYA